MTDKEVGELWNAHRRYPVGLGCDCERCKLIRKLVEERAISLKRQHLRDVQDFRPLSDKVCGTLASRWVPLALNDFNIDPATWPKE